MFPSVIYVFLYLINQHDAAGQWPLLLHFLTTLHVSGASCTHHQEYNNCICSLWHKYASDNRLPTWQGINVAEFIPCHVGRRLSDVYLCQRLLIHLLYSWWWMQEVPETCRVVKKCSNKGHCPAASCWFIKYWYVMHGTMKLKLCILIVMLMYYYYYYYYYALLCVSCFHSGYPCWGFSCFFLSCKANARVYVYRKDGAQSALFLIS